MIGLLLLFYFLVIVSGIVVLAIGIKLAIIAGNSTKQERLISSICNGSQIPCNWEIFAMPIYPMLDSSWTYRCRTCWQKYESAFSYDSYELNKKFKKEK